MVPQHLNKTARSLLCSTFGLLCLNVFLFLKCSPVDEQPALDEAPESYAYSFQIPAAQAGYWIRPVSYLEESNPQLEPTAASLAAQPTLEGFACPGEYEPVSFVLYAQQDLQGVRVEAVPLCSDAGEIPAPEIHAVKRYMVRDRYNRDTSRRQYDSRFLLPFQRVHVPPQTFRQFWITVHVPPEARAGAYTGKLRIVPENAEPSEVTLQFRVLPVQLAPLADKGYGFYYRGMRDSLYSKEEREALILKEWQDIREHGVDRIFLEHKETGNVPVHHKDGTYDVEPWGVKIWKEADGRISYNLDNLRRNFRNLKALGFKGPYIAHSGLLRLARVMSADSVTSIYWQFFDLEVLEQPQYLETARKIIEELKQIKVELDLPELALTHMDEVLVVRQGRDQVPYANALGKITRALAPELRFFQSIHNLTDQESVARLKAIDPYIDIRCYHGHVLGQYLGEGHTFEELRQELEAAGDEAWAYFNPEGVEVTPEWMRVINGVWLWISPVKVHCPWAYNAYHGNPLDDSDGYDYGFAFPVNGEIVATRLWEAFREGIDDMRYIQTLEQLIRQRRQDPQYQEICTSAEQWLTDLRTTLLSLPLKRERTALVKAIAERYTQQDYDAWRQQCAQWIQRLTPPAEL